MPVFDASGPVTFELDLPAGDVLIQAADRAHAVVEIRPTHRSRRADADAAEQTRVEFADGRLLIQAPRSWRRLSFFGAGPAVDVVVQLPAGSPVQAEASWATFRAEGRLGHVRISTGAGVRLESTGDLEVDCSHGAVTVQHVAGRARVVGNSGRTWIHAVEGPAELENSSGSCWIGEATGPVTGQDLQRGRRARAGPRAGHRAHGLRSAADRRGGARRAGAAQLLRRHRGGHPPRHRHLARSRLPLRPGGPVPRARRGAGCGARRGAPRGRTSRSIAPACTPPTSTTSSWR